MSKAAQAILTYLKEEGVITPQLAVDISTLLPQQVIPQLLEIETPAHDICNAVAKVFSYTIYEPANDSEVLAKTSEYVITQKTAYVVNPLDSSLVSKLGQKYPSVDSWGTIAYATGVSGSSSDAALAEFSDSEASDFVNKLIAYAVNVNASDIHIEPDHKRVTVKVRVDGGLQAVPNAQIAHNSYYKIANSLLTQAGLTAGDFINAKDGKFTWINEESESKIQIRLSMVPAAIDASIELDDENYPGTFVLRLAGQNRGLQNIENIGLSNHQLDDLKHVLKAPHGLFLVTGPTGSGKTTTLYGALRYLKKIRPEWAFRTVENPVEVNLQGVTQTQVNPEANADFENILRALLRQDPDLILIGEIRDSETLKTAMDAAMTGHFVFATLHANNAIQAVHRVIRMGAEADMLADVLTATSAQRVTPMLCPNCKILAPLADIVEGELECEIFTSYSIRTLSIANKDGCSDCNHGYSGRQLIAEINRPSKEQKRLISENKSLVEITEQAESDGFTSMWARALELISEGIIDYASADSALGDITQFLRPKSETL